MIKSLINDDIAFLKNEVYELRRKITSLEERLQEKENNETFYQHFLEEKLNARHCATPQGTCDLYREQEGGMLAEIKHYKKFLDAFRQIAVYNMTLNCKDLRIYLFGGKPLPNSIKRIERLAEDYRCSVYLIDEIGGIQKLICMQKIGKKYEHEWDAYIDKYITPDQSAAIKWKELREHFKEWHKDNCEEQILSVRCDEVKQYFRQKLGNERDSRLNGTKVNGFYGYKLEQLL